MSEERADETELQRAIREADEAEARLRRLKESLLPKDRADALEDLLKAELSAMINSTVRLFQKDFVGVQSEEEAHAILERMRDAMLQGTERVKAAMEAQMHAWTLAGLENREAEDACE